MRLTTANDTTPKLPRGRPSIDPEARLIAGSVRMTSAQWAKLDELGGAAWLRDRIDKARVPAKAN